MKKEKLTQTLLLFMAIFGIVVLVFSTHRGPGIGGDATIYIVSARNLLAGHGLGLLKPDGEFRLIPYFPPFYSLLLSVAGLVRIDLVTAAYWLNLFLFGGIIWLAGNVTYRASQSMVFAVFIALLIMLSPALIPVYSWAISEPLAVFLGFIALAMMLEYVYSSEKRVFLIISGVVGGFTFLTRYSAVAYLGAAGLFLLFFNPKDWKKRLKEVMLYFVIGILPMALWVIYDLSQTASVSSRSLESGMGMMERFINLWPAMQDVVLFWLIPNSWITAPSYPSSLNTQLLMVVLIVLIACIILVFSKYTLKSSHEKSAKSLQLAVLLLIFICTYTAVIAFVYITTYPPITIGTRMFAPVHIAVLWLVVVITSLSLDLWLGIDLIKMVLTLGLLLFIVWYGWRSVRIVRQNYELGLGYNSLAWQQSSTIQTVKAMPLDVLIVTNEETAILFLTDRLSYSFAEIYRDKPLTEFTTYGDGDLDSDEAQRFFREDGAAFVLFDTIYSQIEGLYGDRTEERVLSLTQDLKNFYHGEDGGIYYYPESVK